jgi:hypothetical protein
MTYHTTNTQNSITRLLAKQPIVFFQTAFMEEGEVAVNYYRKSDRYVVAIGTKQGDNFKEIAHAAQDMTTNIALDDFVSRELESCNNPPIHIFVDGVLRKAATPPVKTGQS